MHQEIEFPPYNIEKLTEEIQDEELEKIPGALKTGKTEIDPITFSVVVARSEGIMSEMTETILATARNPILYGAKDFTCTLLNARAKVLFMFDCLPAHVGTLSPALKWVIRSFRGDIREGDVYAREVYQEGLHLSGDQGKNGRGNSKYDRQAWYRSP
jgi:N-methylhydantoinase B